MSLVSNTPQLMAVNVYAHAVVEHVTMVLTSPVVALVGLTSSVAVESKNIEEATSCG